MQNQIDKISAIIIEHEQIMSDIAVRNNLSIPTILQIHCIGIICCVTQMECSVCKYALKFVNFKKDFFANI